MNKLDNDNVEVVCEGWLTKSPPTKPILRARWRRRYFILRHSGELPGQYFLWYYKNRSRQIYTDWDCRLLKGKINLDQCEQVDAGLRFESTRQKYQHLFTIKTPKRTFYLAAESEEDMNKWVDCVCHVCGLKPVNSDDAVTDDGDDISQATTGMTELSPPVTPSTIITGPYLPTNDCVSDDTVTDDGDDISQAATGITEISPPVTPSTTITGPYIPISECISGKPIHSDNDLEQFILLHSSNKSISLLPSDHRALPSPSNSICNQAVVPIPPAVNRELKPGRKCSDSTDGSNDRSPILPPAYPPNIDRKLKPAQLKKIQDALRFTDNSNTPITLSSPPVGSLGRRRQRASPSPMPSNNVNSISHEQGFATTGRMHRRHSSSDDRLAPAREESQAYQMNSHTFHSRNRSRHDKKKFREIQYLDLDLDSTDTTPITGGPGLVKKSSENVHTPATATIYQTVDFLKTEAFNRTRIEVEEERNRHCMAESAL